MPWNRACPGLTGGPLGRITDVTADIIKARSDATDREWEIAEAMPPKQGRLGAPSRDGLARGLGRHPVRVGHGMPVAGAAEGFSALFDGHQLFLQVASQRCF